MKVLVCAADHEDKKLAAFASRFFASCGSAELVPEAAFVRTAKKKAQAALVYFDYGLGEKRVLELAAKLDGVEDSAWGVVDRGGEAQDPAAFFRAGASDYVGPALFKAGFSPERLEAVFAFAGLEAAVCEPEEDAFTGWSEIEEGSEVAVRFCYAAVGNQKWLLERIGEKRLGKLRDDFAAFLESWSKEYGGVVWIRDNSGCLVLFPPNDAGMNPTLAALRLLLDRALIGYEVFKLEVPLTFRFAFHRGHTMWRKPGATGSIVSEDVNFAFHLGTKAAGDGYILASADAKRDIPDCIADLFAPAGEFEGRSLVASKRFKD